jgi:CHASE2 domain-containing sensor protein
MRLPFMSQQSLGLFAFTLITLAISYWPPSTIFDDLAYSNFYHLLPDTASEPKSTAIVAIDEKSLAALGPWPWPRQKLAELLLRTDGLGAATIALALPLDKVQPQSKLRELRAELKKSQAKQLLSLLDKNDDDATLSRSLKKAGNIVLMGRESQTGPGNGEHPDIAMETKPAGGAQDYITTLLPLARLPYAEIKHPGFPLPVFRNQAAAIGLQPPPQPYRQTSQPLAVRMGEDGPLVPDFAAAVAGQTLKISSAPSTIIEGQGVQLATTILATDASLRFYPHIYRQGNGTDIPTYSAIDLLEGKIKRQQLHNKTVFIGHTTPRYTTTLAGPADITLTPLEWSATTVDAILRQDYITTPFWSHGLQRLLIIAFAFLLLLLPKKLQRLNGLWLSLVLAIVTVNLSLLALITQKLWLPLALPALYLLAAHLLLILHTYVAGRYRTLKEKLSQAYRELAKNFQNHGQLDRALEYLYLCQPEMAQQEQLYEVGLELERRRQFSKAASVYDHIAAQKRNFRDIQERLTHLRSMPQTLAHKSTNPGSTTATIVIDNSTLAQPVIGRYQIERELGRGAMGTVYLGRDPKIGRTVAIKTLPLTEEFDSKQLEEVRRRFYQEAETAGQLNHPNIVTIYDAGEEHDLAYIAMDYVDGKTLDNYKSPDKLLPIAEVFDIGIKIASALDYAHKKRVVHRDVKPANIIYDSDNGALKVTDFGIAYLTDNSKTRSGTVMGSPNYMSPEQISGRKVDARSDIFSLGVTLYELFTGELPFAGDTMATLLYCIANDKHKSVRRIRPELPPCLVKIINKALAKKVTDRYASAAEMEQALSRCKANLS